MNPTDRQNMTRPSAAMRILTAPGERYQYSNLGFGLLDYVIERSAKKKYADFIERKSFFRWGMTHSSIDIAPGLESA